MRQGATKEVEPVYIYIENFQGIGLHECGD